MARIDDFYITILKYGRSALVEPEDVNYNEVRDHVKSIHPNMEDKAFSKIFWSTFHQLDDFGKSYLELVINNTPHALNIEAYFHLLEHEELKEARTSSKRALWVAFGAIVISAFLAAASISIQLKIPTNVVVDTSQFDRVLNASAAPHNVVLDQSQLEQLLKSNDRPMNVILDEKQLDKLIEKISRSNDPSQ